MKPNKILVCGDSFLSCDLNYPGTHFSELLADYYDCELISLARQGISTNSIRLQCNECLKYNPDLVLIGGTDETRFELPMKSLYPNNNFKEYNKQNGLGNIEYRHYPNLSKTFVDNSACSLWSDHFSKFFDENAFPNDVLQAWKYYLGLLHDPNWKKQIDEWVVESSIFFLEQNKFSYIYLPNGHYIPDCASDQKIFDYNIPASYQSDRSYHTSDEEQQTLFHKLKEKINEL